MRIVEVYKNPTNADLKILVEDIVGEEKKEYLVFIEKNSYIVNLGKDRPMDELMKVKAFVNESLKEAYSETIIPTT